MMSSLETAQLHSQLRESDLEALEAYKRGVAEAPTLYAPGYMKAAKDEAGTMVFVANEESEDRFGDVISADAWQLDNFQKNPVLMFVHDYSIAPVGLVPKVWVQGKQLLNTAQFDAGDPFAMFLKGKYERGFMKAESVGFRALEFEERMSDEDGQVHRRSLLFKKVELLEISLVPIPAHPMALQKMMGDRKFSIIMPTLEVIEMEAPQSQAPEVDWARVLLALQEIHQS